MFTLLKAGNRQFDDMFSTEAEPGAIPVSSLSTVSFEAWQKEQSQVSQHWLKAERFTAAAGQVSRLPNEHGELSHVAFGLGPNAEVFLSTNPYAYGALAPVLPDGTYRVEAGDPQETLLACLGWAAGSYRFEAYKSPDKSPKVRLEIPENVDADELRRLTEAVFFVRDLVNVPANQMDPTALENACRQLATAHDASVSCIAGDDLLRRNFPLVHAVGRASVQAPRLVDIMWGKSSDPAVTLVGKGVCFDSGGLNLKPGNSMALMKKDMGGAAHVLGLAHLIMSARLPVRLRVLVPIVENAVSGSAFRPGDVITSRKGDSVEIGNTDAEGRLILADALSYACEEKPEMLIDMATLTGAARVALGPDLPPFYTDNDVFADALSSESHKARDPLWRMPLWGGYTSWLDSRVADVNHIADAPMAGSVTAALFLKRFVTNTNLWAHFDVYAWTLKPKPGQAVGGEAQAIRALYGYVKNRFK